jgi:hypothetical protein
MSWKGCGRKRSWPNFKYYCSFCMERFRKLLKLSSMVIDVEIRKGTFRHEYQSQKLPTVFRHAVTRTCVWQTLRVDCFDLKLFAIILKKSGNWEKCGWAAEKNIRAKQGAVENRLIQSFIICTFRKGIPLKWWIKEETLGLKGKKQSNGEKLNNLVRKLERNMFFMDLNLMNNNSNNNNNNNNNNNTFLK